MVGLLLFDCDGVLVDTEPLANRCFAEALNEAGLDWSVEQTMRRLVGRSLASCVEIVERELGRSLPPDFVERLQARTFDAFRREGVAPIAGVADAIETLDRRGWRRCVASSGELAKMRLTLGMTGLLAGFDGRLFSASMVARGKPYPDLFLHAAAAMGAEPRACVVIEDAVPGVMAGRAAGMRVLAYAGAPHADRDGLRQAGGETFDRMADLPELLG